MTAAQKRVRLVLTVCPRERYDESYGASNVYTLAPGVLVVAVVFGMVLGEFWSVGLQTWTLEAHQDRAGGV